MSENRIIDIQLSSLQPREYFIIQGQDAQQKEIGENIFANTVYTVDSNDGSNMTVHSYGGDSNNTVTFNINRLQSIINFGKTRYLYTVIKLVDPNSYKRTISTTPYVSSFWAIPGYAGYGGSTQKHKYKGRYYKIRTGTRGGKYIVVKGDKIYV